MITIGIASYNQQEYLSDAIESALDQTVKAEVIVCNDGSTDNSLVIAQKYPVKVIDQENKGLSEARNTCIKNMTGDWFLPLDADDILLSTAVEKIEKFIKENPDVDVIGLSAKLFGINNGDLILKSEPKLEDFRIGNHLGYCSAIRKSKLDEVGGYSPKMVWGYEDLHLWINLLTKGAKIKTIPEMLWLYRTKADSMWTKTEEHHWELLEIINKDFPEAKLSFKHAAS